MPSRKPPHARCIESYVNRKRPYAVVCGLIAAVAIVAVALPASADTWFLQGRVYDGEIGDESRPIQGVEVGLFGAFNEYPTEVFFIRSTTTNAAGWYGLEVYDDDAYEYIQIRETDPVDFVSVGATSVSGIVREPNIIEYVHPPDGLTLTGNKFWDQGPTTPTATPTLTPTWTPTPTASHSPTSTPTPTPTVTPTPEPGVTVLEGRVFEGNEGDFGSPIGGVTVSVFGSNDPYPDEGVPLESTQTNGDGHYALLLEPEAKVWEYYHLIEDDLPGFDSVAASSPTGNVRDPNWIEFPIPLPDGVLSANHFWDVGSATATPTPTATRIPTPTSTPTPRPTLTPDCDELLVNGDFETGLEGWESLGPVFASDGRGGGGAVLGGEDESVAELAQAFRVPEGTVEVGLALWWRAESGEPQPDDRLEVVAYTESGPVSIRTLAAADLNEWHLLSVELPPVAGQDLQVAIVASTDAAVPTLFRIDDVSVRACSTGGGTSTPTPTPTPTRTRTTTPGGSTTITICPIAGVSFDQLGSSDWGSGEMLVAWGLGPGEAVASRILLRFDLSFIPVGTQLISAYLEAEQFSGGGASPVDLAVHEVIREWQDSTVHWSNQPPWVAAAAAHASIPTAPGISSWNVTQLVAHWMDGNNPNNGLLIRGEESGTFWQRVYRSRHNTSFCPRLVLEMKGAVGTPTATHTPTRTPTPTSPCPQPDAAGDTFATAASLPATGVASDYICGSGDVDFWKTSVTKGHEIIAGLGNLPADYDLVVVRPDQTGAAASRNWNKALGEYVRLTADATGEWGFNVHGKKPTDWSHSQKYELALSVCGDSVDTEAGDTFDKGKKIQLAVPSVGIASTTKGFICSSSDVDFYRFYVTNHRGKKTTLTANLTSLPKDYRMAFYSPAGYKVGPGGAPPVLGISSQSSNDDGGPGTGDKTISFAAKGLTTGLWGLKVWGATTADYDPADSYKLEVQINGIGDLAIGEVEVTQSIQSIKNDIDLVQGKSTVARVYVTSTGLSSIGKVQVKAYGWSDSYGGTKLPGSPLTKTATALWTTSDTWDRRGWLPASINVYLPSSWVKVPKVYLRFEVNGDKAIPESDYANNVAKRTLDVQTLEPLVLQAVTVTANGYTADLAGPEFKSMLREFSSAYPMTSIQLLLGGGLNENHAYTKGPYDCGHGWNSLLKSLSGRHQSWLGRSQHARTFGFLNTLSVSSSICGCAHIGTPVAAGQLDTNSCGWVLQHELGHTYGLHHTPPNPGDRYCGSTGDVDDGYPHYRDTKGNDLPRASIGEFGVDVSSTVCWPPPCNDVIYDPGDVNDYMSYCSPVWISAHMYTEVMKTVPGYVGATSAEIRPAGEYLVVSGRVENGVVELDPAMVDWYLPSDMPSGEGRYRIVLEDSAGAEIDSRSFDLLNRPYGMDPDSGVFFELFTPSDRLHRIVVEREGTEVHAVQRSANPPSVTLIKPAGGESWGEGEHAVSWAMSDNDGDGLSASVYYSNDDGNTWTLVAAGLEETSLSIDGSVLAGGDSCRIKVRVSDGLDTSEAVSPPILVASKPTTVLLLRPESGEVIPSEAPLVLEALATDLEDGPVEGQQLVWTSNRDGDLGQGTSVWYDSPSCGAHTITVSADETSVASADVFSLADCGDRIVVIPAGAHVDGVAGTSWVTDAVLHNPSESPVDAYLYLMRTSSTEDTGLGIDIPVPAGSSVLLRDLFAEQFAVSGSGAVLLAADSPMVVASRTYNNATVGSYGQFIPGFAISQADSGSTRPHLIQLTRNDDYRTNIGVANVGPVPVALTVFLLDAMGDELGRRSLAVEPYRHLQVNDVLSGLGTGPVDDAVAVVVAADPTTPYFTYASVIDNHSGDPVYVSPVERHAEAAYIPAAAHVPGVNQALWRTDLEVVNRSTEQVRFRIDLLAADRDNTEPPSLMFELEPERAMRYEDVVGLFSYTGPAALRIVPLAGEVMLSSRTFNQVDDATFGQYIPAVAAADALGHGETARLVQLAGSTDPSSGFRTNIGLTSSTPVEIEVVITLLDAAGGFLGERTVVLPPFSFHQENRIISGVSGSSLESAVAVIRSDSEGARYFAYASVIDNRSGDPVFIPAIVPRR